MVSVRAVYRGGRLHLLDPIDLQEGQEVRIHILESSGTLASAAADLLVRFEVADEHTTAFDEDNIQAELDAALAGKRSLSEIIIAERHDES